MVVINGEFSVTSKINPMATNRYALRKMYPYLQLFWSVFSLIRIAYGEILGISPYSVQMGENAGQNYFEYGLFSRNDKF